MVWNWNVFKYLICTTLVSFFRWSTVVFKRLHVVLLHVKLVRLMMKKKSRFLEMKYLNWPEETCVRNKALGIMLDKENNQQWGDLMWHDVSSNPSCHNRFYWLKNDTLYFYPFSITFNSLIPGIKLWHWRLLPQTLNTHFHHNCHNKIWVLYYT